MLFAAFEGPIRLPSQVDLWLSEHSMRNPKSLEVQKGAGLRVSNQVYIMQSPENSQERRCALRFNSGGLGLRQQVSASSAMTILHVVEGRA